MSSISTTYAVAFADDPVGASARTLLNFGFTQAQIDKADFCMITSDGAACRFRYDGIAPTASVGMYLRDGGIWIMEGQQNISQLQFIAASGTAYVAITLESYNP